MPTPTFKRRNILAAVIGNALEWYDYLVFAFMTPIVAKLFFPANPDDPDSSVNQILLTLAIFGVGFLMRPIGGIVLGMYGDRKGRKAAMVMATAIMAVAITIITFSPTYAQVGVAAPIIILIARLLQGFAAGGEFGTSTALLIEIAPPGKRGFYGSWQMTGQMAAQFIGAITGTLVTVAFTSEQLMAWAWRIPFAVGLLIIPVALYIRRHVDEPEVFKQLQARQAEGRIARITLGQMLVRYKRETLTGMGLVVTSTVSFYITFTYLVTFSTVTLKLPLRDSFLVQMAGAAWMVLLMPFMGAWSDRVGRRRLLIGSLVGYLVVVWPLHAWLTDGPTINKLLTVQLIVCLFVSVFYSVFGTIMAELFPANVRSLGMSMAYNIAVMIFGGFAQFIVTWLIKITGSPMAPSYYVIFGVTVGLITAFFIRDKTDEEVMALQ